MANLEINSVNDALAVGPRLVWCARPLLLYAEPPTAAATKSSNKMNMKSEMPEIQIQCPKTLLREVSELTFNISDNPGRLGTKQRRIH